ncbi:hypothetical protein QE152_g9388 [Popillia japonica]
MPGFHGEAHIENSFFNEKKMWSRCTLVFVNLHIQHMKAKARVYNNPARKWVFGTVVAKTGHLHYDILIDGSIHRRHVDQLLLYPGVLPLERHHIPNSSTSPSTEGDDSKIEETATGETSYSKQQYITFYRRR